MLEILRMVTDWLGDATYGVAAKLAALTFDGSDAAPTGTLVIGDETRNAKAAVGQYPGDWSIGVHLQPVDSLEGQSATYTHDFDVPILLRLSRKDSATAAARRDLLYTMRAAVQSLNALDATAVGDAARQRNNMQATNIVSLGQALTKEQLEDNIATGAIAVTWRARDLIA